MLSQRARKKQELARIRDDFESRKSDPSWRAKVSSAAAKDGTAMQTFRDQYGEDGARKQ